MKIQRTTYLSLGSNQGNKIEILYGNGAGSGNEQFNGEALKLEYMSLVDFNMLKCE